MPEQKTFCCHFIHIRTEWAGPSACHKTWRQRRNYVSAGMTETMTNCKERNKGGFCKDYEPNRQKRAWDWLVWLWGCGWVDGRIS